MKSILMSFLVILIFLVSSCDSGTKDPDAGMGSEGGKCYPVGTCDDGLVCDDGICVKESSGTDEDTDVSLDDEQSDDSNKGDIGDKCNNHSDCKDYLKCVNGTCRDLSSDPDIDKEVDEDIDDEQNDEYTDDGIPDEEPDGPEPDRCGNGILDPGEECDLGQFNSDEPGTHGETCRTDCTYARCGDGIIDKGEICDKANYGDGIGVYCSDNCKAITGSCGDGILQENEVCDKANFGDGIGKYCSDDCKEVIGSCGDGTKQENEMCDNAAPDVGAGEGIGPYCSDDCKKIVGACGDGVLQSNELCDDGDNNGKYGFCNLTCDGDAMACGDGTFDYGYEACDKAEPDVGAGEGIGSYCSDDCSEIVGECGDGILQDFEACDKAEPGLGGGEGVGAYCSNDCKTLYGYCGDEIKQDNEDCDYGGDNGWVYCPYGQETTCMVCSNNCELEEGIVSYCGDGKVDGSNDEICDKAINPYCSDDCKSIIGSCGDGIKQDFEACDKADFGDGIGPYYCSDDCTEIIGYCGDGTPQDNEDCDWGENNTEFCSYGEEECTVCDPNCKLSAGLTRYCGDNIVHHDFEEVCDKGKAVNGTYKAEAPGNCSADCKSFGSGGYCGDNTLQAEHEECDLGGNNGKLECTYGETSCRVCTSQCKDVAGETSYCGDNIKDTENGEVCDHGEVVNGTYKAEEPGACNSDCKGYGAGGYCGDNIHQELYEGCDYGGNNGVLDCPYGDESCDVCTESCTLVAGNTSYCGDSVIDNGNGEVCDQGEALNGTYKASHPGNCSADCKSLGSGGYCGDGTVQEGYEECDHNGVVNLDCPYGESSCTVCNENCELVPGNVTGYCGDGTLQEEHEECEHSGNIDLDCGYGEESCTVCNSECKLVPGNVTGYCGDGVLQEEHEICDHGGIIETDCEYGQSSCNVCNENCEHVPGNVVGYCGDGTVQGEYGEECDHSGTVNLDCVYGEASCVVCNEECKEVAGNVVGWCGDNTVQEEYFEICDQGSLNGTYDPYGDGYCSSNCQSYGDGGYCGDAIPQYSEGEECDEGSLNGSPSSECWTNCKLKGVCGDEEIGYGELCDSNTVLCSELSNRFQSGTETADCLGDCLGYDTSSCTPEDIERLGLFDSGQTECYDNSGVIVCPASGNFFYGQDSQYPYKNKVFTVSGDTVSFPLNPVIQMVWSNTTPSTYSGCTINSGQECTLAEAESYCENLDVEGLAWRLPNTYELQTLINYGVASAPLIFSEFNILSDIYWTSTQSASFGYAVNFTNGATVTHAVGSGAKVVCVSEGSIDATSFKEIQCRSELTSSLYNLIWLRLDTAQTWQDALSVCESSTVENHTFWRMPNINELQILLNDRSSSPASTMPGIALETIWSSTTDPVDNTKAFMIDTTDGTIYPADKTGTKTVYCVSDIPELLNCPQ